MHKLKCNFKYKYIKLRSNQQKTLLQKIFKTLIINNSEYLRRKTSADYKDFKLLISMFNEKFETKLKLLISECSKTLNVYDWNIITEFHRFTDDGHYGINIMAENNRDKHFFHITAILDNVSSYNINKDIFTNINIKEVEHVLDKANIDNMFLYGSTGHAIYSNAFKKEIFNEHEVQLKKFLKIIDNQNIINEKKLERDLFSTKFLINKDIKWSLQFSNSGLFNTGPNYIYTPFYSIKNISKKDFLCSIIEAKYIKVGEDYLDIIENNSFEDILEYIRIINY
jgi:hypothetical protein